jgi:type IV secretion system protein VirD4
MACISPYLNPICPELQLQSEPETPVQTPTPEAIWHAAASAISVSNGDGFGELSTMRGGLGRVGRMLGYAVATLLWTVGGALGQADDGSVSQMPDFSAFPPDQVFIAVIVGDLVAGVLGFVIGFVFFSPLMSKVRWYGLLGLLALLIGTLVVSSLYSHPSNTIATLGYLGGLVAFFWALLYARRLGRKKRLARSRSEPDPPTSYGSAKWATYAHLEERHLFEGKGFFLGQFPARGGETPLHYPGTRHLLTVAPTRSGKGVSAIIPNLLSYEGSAFVIDPKGENALITAARRGNGDVARQIQGMGQFVFLVDPWDIAASAVGLTPSRFNPLDWIVADDPDAAENAFLLADALVYQEASQGSGSERFWDDEAKALLTGLILFVATSPTESARRHLGRVRDIVTTGDDKLKEVLVEMAKSKLPVVASTAMRTMSKEPKLRSSVMAAVQSHTHFLDSPRIRESLSSSDFEFEYLKTLPTTIYLILPADRLKTFDRWLRLLIQQAITVNARNIRAKPERPALFLLDEMPSLGRLTMVEQAYGLMAGFGMQLWGIVQDLNQLRTLYGEEGWQTFISNSGVIQYFGSRDQATAEYFSALCGVTTVRPLSLSSAIAAAIGTAISYTSSFGEQGSSSSTTHGTNEGTTYTQTVTTNEAQRKLAYADELMVLKGESEIVFVENFDPIKASKILWYEDPRFRDLGVNLAKDGGAPSPQQEVPPEQPSGGSGFTAEDILKEFMEGFGKPTTAADEQPEAEQPAPAAPEPEPPPPDEPKPARTELRRFSNSGGTVITYSDKSVDFIETDGRVLSFDSLDELKLYVRQRHRLERPPEGTILLYKQGGAVDFFKPDGALESYASLTAMQEHYGLKRPLSPRAEIHILDSGEVVALGFQMAETFATLGDLRVYFSQAERRAHQPH